MSVLQVACGELSLLLPRCFSLSVLILTVFNLFQSRLRCYFLSETSAALVSLNTYWLHSVPQVELRPLAVVTL